MTCISESRTIAIDGSNKVLDIPKRTRIYYNFAYSLFPQKNQNNSFIMPWYVIHSLLVDLTEWFIRYFDYSQVQWSCRKGENSSSASGGMINAIDRVFKQYLRFYIHRSFFLQNYFERLQKIKRKSKFRTYVHCQLIIDFKCHVTYNTNEINRNFSLCKIQSV